MGFFDEIKEILDEIFNYSNYFCAFFSAYLGQLFVIFKIFVCDAIFWSISLSFNKKKLSKSKGYFFWPQSQVSKKCDFFYVRPESKLEPIFFRDLFPFFFFRDLYANLMVMLQNRQTLRLIWIVHTWQLLLIQTMVRSLGEKRRGKWGCNIVE